MLILLILIYFCIFYLKYNTKRTELNMKFILDLLMDFLENNVLMVALLAWMSAQVIKAILNTIINREFSLERLFGDGGMPSGHSATVTAAAVVCAWTYGFNSAYCGIAFVVAIIVMHDATGVRREAGRHAGAINKIVEKVNNETEGEEDNINIARLKEFVGHTPTQVLVGFILGFIVAILFCVIAKVPYGEGMQAEIASQFMGLFN